MLSANKFCHFLERLSRREVERSHSLAVAHEDRSNVDGRVDLSFHAEDQWKNSACFLQAMQFIFLTGM